MIHFLPTGVKARLKLSNSNYYFFDSVPKNKGKRPLSRIFPPPRFISVSAGIKYVICLFFDVKMSKFKNIPVLKGFELCGYSMLLRNFNVFSNRRLTKPIHSASIINPGTSRAKNPHTKLF